MKSYFLRRSFRLLASVPRYVSLPALPCLLLASTSTLATAATPVASSQPVAKSHVSANGKHASAPSRRKNTAPRNGATEEVEVSQTHTHRYLSQPATVNVISGQELRALHLESPKDIASFTPGVTASNAVSGSAPIFSIRGVGLDDYVGTNMGGIGIYLDGLLAPFPVFYTGQMLDIESVSTEKGPQGFDMGRSTTGGSINIQSVKPSDKFGGYAEWGYSSYNTNHGRFAINTPITNKIFNRFAFNYVKGDGWQKDISTGDRYGSQDLLALRNLTKFVVDDTSSVLLNIHYTRDKGRSTSPQDISQPSDGGAGLHPSANSVNVGNSPPHRNENGGGVSVNYTKAFDFGTFSSTTGIDFYRRNDLDNYDGVDTQVADYRWNDTAIAQSHDMHLRMNLAKIFHLTVGVYESYDKIDGEYTSYRGATKDPHANFTNHFSQQNVSTGLYINTVTNITKKLDFLAGGRLSYDERGFNGGTRSYPIGSASSSQLSYLNTTHSYHRFTGRVGLRYEIVPNTYAYGTISNGYKAGSYFVAPVLLPQALDYVKPENLIAYEIGIKSSLLHNKVQLEGSLFDYEYHNRQTLFFEVFDPVNSLNSLTLGTIPRARTRGGEISGTFHDVIPNLDLHGSFAYLDAQSKSTVLDDGGNALVTKNSSLPFSPRFSWSAVARYGIDISRYRTTLQASFTWKDNMWAALGDPNAQNGKISSLGLRMEFGPKTGKWNAAVYVDNLQNNARSNYSFTGNDGNRVQYIQTPRWIGCDLHYNF
ncbi:TonB-dependent receptor [Acetobacter okinawensis]|uniref:TonB-dependent receptor n=1 Tax=Acetobacter okinawensis TaxID=1076594 RepID=A0A252BUD8_9PROT|nr:TonB-dependent receptor [Acetobacter okinawensis]OUJ12421.1 TonB-dependent receptor [Acetobacter okinawensis]